VLGFLDPSHVALLAGSSMVGLTRGFRLTGRFGFGL